MQVGNSDSAAATGDSQAPSLHRHTSNARWSFSIRQGLRTIAPTFDGKALLLNASANLMINVHDFTPKVYVPERKLGSEVFAKGV